ncbi:hypothetical protein QQS21_007634 [Conoideocrella luteorostrata]|uniref:Amidase domain-containing protein n=1 Tax=Conoideocrella luteorostrata TaxID=1105319 RepID=A0AAJ0FX76_9HYPO|nr:hypothetical protein QQS21_007634 [Conoideocrella luteorostrata]
MSRKSSFNIRPRKLQSGPILCMQQQEMCIKHTASMQIPTKLSFREHYPLRAAIASAAGLTIAVPSRLYAAPSPEKPLAGVRIAVKDLFDLKGVKTGGGNRAYYQTSSVRNRTAASVERLIDAGAIVVGKTKLSEFAFGGPYVTDHIDYLLPFNPRGDGRNSPSDSSGGSGASVASYEWLDASLGSDTGGSIRGPAAWNGVYGNRPSHGAVDLAGTIPLSPSMDTVGTLTRDPELWNTINNVLYAGAFQKYLDLPKKILLDPESSKQISSLRSQYPNITGEIDKFLNKLTQIMSGKISTFSVDDAWNKSTPAAFNTTRLASAVDLIYSKLTLYEQWNIFGKDFVKEYMETHSGDFPPMLPAIRQGWVIVNASLTQRGHQGDLRDKAGVADWVAKNFLVSDTKTCSNALYVYFTFPTTSYKLDVAKDISNPSIAGLQSTLLQQKIQLLTMNVTINCNTTLGSEELCKNSTKILSDATTKPVNPVYVGRLASIADLPDYTVPLGSFDLGELTSSKSTLRNQSLPLAVNLVAAKGCDLMLLDLIHKLYRRGAIRGAGVGSII